MTHTVEYRGEKFRRYPNSTNRTDRVYFTPGIAAKKRGVKRLHEEIWMAHNGPIPTGHHIHHIDGDPLNNDPANLEALPREEHMRHHHKGQCSDRKREHLAAVRPKAAAWHSSPEGIEWHRKHAEQQSLGHGPERTEACEQCGVTYTTHKRSTVRFCSNKCKSQWRRASGLDDEDRTCAACGATFRVNRYSKKRCCNGKCAWKLRRQPIEPSGASD